MGGPAGKNPGLDPDLPGDFEGQAAYRQLYPEDVTSGREGKHRYARLHTGGQGHPPR